MRLKIVNAHFFNNLFINFINFNKISLNKSNFSRKNVILVLLNLKIMLLIDNFSILHLYQSKNTMISKD